MSLILTILIEFLSGIITFIFTPIDSMLDTYLPSINSGLGYISSFFNHINGYIQFVVGWLSLPTYALNLISAWIVYILVVRPLVYGVKIIIKWIKTLKA